MKDNLAIRSLLVDKDTGRYLKAVDEHGLDDYILLFSKKDEKSEITIFDFSKAIDLFHNELDKKLNARDYRDLTIKRKTVFNTWVRLKSLTNSTMLYQTALQVSRDAEEVLNWIYTRIPELVKNYKSAPDSSLPGRRWENEKNSALLKVSNELEVFLEILLCHIHATLKVDINYFKSDFVLNQHCMNIREIVLDALKNELNYWNKDFRDDSMIFQLCMENMGVHTEVIINQINPNFSITELKNKILNTATIEDKDDGYRVVREYRVYWPKYSNESIDRVKILSRLLQKIDSVIFFLEDLKNYTVKFNDDNTKQKKFENSLESYILENKA